MENKVTHLPTVASQQGLTIQNFDDLMRISEFLARSELIPTTLRKKPADVAIILMKGNELGLQAMQALDSIDVIQGKPALKPEAQLALIYQRVPGAFIQIEVDDKTSTVTVAMSRDAGGKQAFKTVWTMARAAKMGLDKKDNYLKQPLVMLKWRAVGEAARTVFPDVTRGLFNSFEAEDFVEPGEDKGARLAAALADEKPAEVTVVSEVLPPAVEPEPVVVKPTPAPVVVKPVQRAPTATEMTTEHEQRKAKAAAAMAEVQAKLNAKAAAVKETTEPSFDDFDQSGPYADPAEVPDGDVTCPLKAHNGVKIRSIPKVVLAQMVDWIQNKHDKPVPTELLDFAAAANRFIVNG